MRTVRTALLALALGAGAASPPARGQADPSVLIPGWTLAEVSAGVNAIGISQLAFRPGDAAHLFSSHTPGVVFRYDYDAATGTLSNQVQVANTGGQMLGLAFHGDDLYVSLDIDGDGRLSRFSAPDLAGIYQVRHDFVHSVPIGQHDVNQIQIDGDTLYVGIGAIGFIGDPAEETIYNMTVARIADLTQVDFSGPIGPDFKGAVNHLADETAWLDTSASDGLLRYFASGFRNPFGIALDPDGDLWVATNGNHEEEFLSFDLLYAEVPPGGQGDFPPPSFGFPPLISGTPIEPVANLGQNPAVTGLAFVPSGPEAGRVVQGQAGASDQANFPVGKDVVLVDPATGSFPILVDGMGTPTDVAQDPFGRLLIADFSDNSIWLLVPPAAAAGRVPGGVGAPGSPLTVEHGGGGDITLSWSPSCAGGDDDYAVYEGTLDGLYDHSPLLCSTAGGTAATFAPGPGNRYYLAVPAAGIVEGSYGRDTEGGERPAASAPCLPQAVLSTCT